MKKKSNVHVYEVMVVIQHLGAEFFAASLVFAFLRALVVEVVFSGPPPLALWSWFFGLRAY